VHLFVSLRRTSTETKKNMRSHPVPVRLAALTPLLLTAATILAQLPESPAPLTWPDWSNAGNPDAHHESAGPTLHATDFGAVANDSLDDAAGIQAVIWAAEEAGGAIIRLQPGIYFLDHPILVTGNNVHLRGAGPSQTRLIFRYIGPEAGPEFLYPKANAPVGPNTWIEIHAQPEGLTRFSLFADGRLIHSQDPPPRYAWQQDFALRLRGQRILRQANGEAVTLLARAEYADGRVLEATRDVMLSPKLTDPPRIPQVVGMGAITFLGARPHGDPMRLAETGRRGDTVLVLENPDHPFERGSRIQLVAPNTDRWFGEIRNKGPHTPDYRRYHLLVTKVDGPRLHIDQPLRIPFPVEDGAVIRLLDPIRNSSIESLELEMRSSLQAINGIMFLNAWACRARDLSVLNAGRHQLLFSGAKWCRVSDSIFRDRRNKGGGTDYVGFQDAYDCLMENVTAMDMRHGPLVQWSAAGNVIRDSRFLGSDAQWHAGWANENLFENCLIVSRPETGSYGYGMWASPPEDTGHGASGPRNVVYNCDIASPAAGVWLGGMNDGWQFHYNRFLVEDGPGMILNGPAKGHVVRGNVFVLKNPLPAAFHLTSSESVELSFIDNNAYMPADSRLFAGPGKPAVDSGNKILPYPPGELPELPRPEIQSVFLWQREQAAGKGPTGN
jgi:hypothetical protein